MATVYSDRGHGVRAPVVFYNRCNEAAAQLKPGDFDWKAIFAGGVRWFHSGGIFAALRRPRRTDHRGMKAAKAAGAVVSFDLNFREKLWQISGGHEKAQDASADRPTSMCWSATRRTCRRAWASRDRTSTRSRSSTPRLLRHDGPGGQGTPNIKIVATTLREVHTTNRHDWSAVAWVDGKT